MTANDRTKQIRARRRLVMRVGLAAIVLATLTACIFDQGDYQGGGRKQNGGSSQIITATTATDTTTAPTSTTDDAGDPIQSLLDAADADAG